MFSFQAIWNDGRLHLWAVRDQQADMATGHSAGRFATHAETEGLLVDAWGQPQVFAAIRDHLLLRLPVWTTAKSHGTGDHELTSIEVPTIAVCAAEAVDLLTAQAGPPPTRVLIGDSVRFWSCLAKLVLELLARQSFVPAVHLDGEGSARGYWRVVVSDDATSARLGALIGAMPPVCRSVASTDAGPAQASALVEEFLWRSIDQLVRRCMKGDDLAQAIQSKEARHISPQMHWLQSLVAPDAGVHAAREDLEYVHSRVRPWLARLEPPPPARSFRTCLRLEPPANADGPDVGGAVWRLTLHVQSTTDPAVILEADRLLGNGARTPSILRRPFEGALSGLREDVARAARRFPPLEVCAASDGPLECGISVGEAYSFLRDAAPALERDGFGVWLPGWWRPESPRLRMQLALRPVDDGASAGAMRLDSIVEYDWRIALGDETIDEDELARLAAEKLPMLRLRGTWAEVRPEDALRALDFVRKHRAGVTTLFDALRRCYLADDLETGLPVTGIRAEGWIDRLLNASEGHVRISDVSPPSGFRGTLRPYQLRGLQWLRFLSQIGLGGCLADDMGLGKTIQLIALLLLEQDDGGVHGPTLLIVPMSLVGNWYRELGRFAPTLKVLIHHGLERPTGSAFLSEAPKYDVVISTYSLAHRDFESLSGVRWRRIALDEAQNIKNPGSKQSQAIRALPAGHRLALTGTPVENHLTELWAIMDFLNEGYLGSVTDFRQRFAIPIERHRDDDRAHRLRQLIRPFVLRRMKSDPAIEVDLPPKMEMTVYCNLTREQAALYEAVVNEMLMQIDRSTGMQRRGLVLATLIKLKQVCNHPVQFLREDGDLDQRSGKCERLSEMLDEVLSEGDRALVFTQYRVMGELLKRLLEQRFGEPVLFLHGGTTRGDRERMVDHFQSGNGSPKVFVLSLKAGGFGLNLTAANHVFHYDRWWNPAVEDQATDRAHRIGQERRVQVHKFVCVGTLEERIHAMLEQKRSLADHIIGGGEGWITELSTEALRDLFSLSRDAVADE